MEKFRILSLDGGGIRGVITAVILGEIERKLGKKLQDHFHLIAGTSTGSILAAGIANGYMAKDLLEFYEKLGKTIFPEEEKKSLLLQDIGDIANRVTNRWMRISKEGFDHAQYENVQLIKALKEKLQSPKRLKDLNKNLVLITTYNASERQPVLMCNWHKDWADVPIWQACVSSASAPTFFPPFELEIENPNSPGKRKAINLIDGGMFANNPTTCALAQALKLSDDPNDSQIIENHTFPMPSTGRDNFFSSVSVLSIGTGDSTRPILYEDSKNWGTLQWIAPLIDVMFDGSNVINDRLVECLIGNSDSYLRLQPTLDKDKGSDDIDDASDENIEKLKKTANDYIDNLTKQEDIDRFLRASS